VKHAAWSDEVAVVDVPVWRFAFAAPDLRDTVMRAWSDRRPDGRYEVVVDRSAGELLSFRAPVRGPNLTTGLVLFLLVVTVPGLVGMAFGLLGAVVGVVASVAAH
jgi:hypothetical protein